MPDSQHVPTMLYFFVEYFANPDSELGQILDDEGCSVAIHTETIDASSREEASAKVKLRGQGLGFHSWSIEEVTQ